MTRFSFSGDLIDIRDNHVIKVCQTDQQRFIKNIDKQKYFNNHFIKAVPILERGTRTDNKHYIKMPLLQCEPPLIWLSKASAENIEALIDLIKQYLQSILQASRIDCFNFDVWSNKVHDVRSKINDLELRNVCCKLLDLDCSIPMYYGPSHGDFTFSNMFIYQDGKVNIDVIDFLDTFMESPIHDFVKIRQDTKHLWTLQLIDGVDRNKIVMVLHHIDLQIKKIIDSDHIIGHYYQYFQVLNMLRIIPYSKSSDTIRYLKKEIQKCLL